MFVTQPDRRGYLLGGAGQNDDGWPLPHSGVRVAVVRNEVGGIIENRIPAECKLQLTDELLGAIVEGD